MSLMSYQSKVLRAGLGGWLAIVLLLLSFTASARGTYQTAEQFLNDVFNQQLPRSHVVWMKGGVKQQVEKILGHDYAGLRIRFWRDNVRSAWILEEVGKEEPITFGVVVNQQRVEQVKVLAYRESRGEEIRYPAFTQQFHDASLNDRQLDRHIDGISGATLSVRAMTKVVTLALYLDAFTSHQS